MLKIVKSFVSRLGINTTSEDLCYFLTQVGMKDGKVVTTAFQVSCFDESRDLMKICGPVSAFFMTVYSGVRLMLNEVYQF